MGAAPGGADPCVKDGGGIIDPSCGCGGIGCWTFHGGCNHGGGFVAS